MFCMWVRARVGVGACPMRVQSMRVQRLPLKLLTTTRLLPPSPFSLLRSEHSCALALVALVAGAGGHDCGGGGEGFTYFFSFFRRFRFLLGERLSIGPRFRQLVRRRKIQPVRRAYEESLADEYRRKDSPSPPPCSEDLAPLSVARAPSPTTARPPTSTAAPRVRNRTRRRPDSCQGHAPLGSAAAAPRESLPVEADAEEEVVEDDPGCDEYSSMRSRGVSAKACAHNQHPQDGPHCRAAVDKNRTVYGPRPRKLAPAACTVLARL